MSSTTETPTDAAAVSTPPAFVGEDRFDQLILTQEELIKSFKENLKYMKDFKKEYTKEKKAFVKNSKKKKIVNPDEPQKQNGFSKPLNISDELKNFLQVPADTMLSRTSVTKQIAAYIREHNLTNPENKREIDPWTGTPEADKLLSLLSPLPPKSAEDPLTWFVLQKYLARHYPKTVVTSIETPSAPPPTPEPVKKPSNSARKVSRGRVRTKA